MPKSLARHVVPALVLLAFAHCSRAQWIPANPVTGVQKEADGALIHMQTGTLKLQVCTESIIHVLYSPTGKFPPPNVVVVKDAWPSVDWHLDSSDKGIVLSTTRIRVMVARNDGTITYLAGGRAPLLSEGPKLMMPKTVGARATFAAEDVFKIYGSEEAFYGLGQHQAGVWNFRGESIDLSQENANIAVPFFISSKGYGVFWNNTSASRWNNRFVHFLYLHSDYADAIDYYFFYGPDFDKIIADYRGLTGATPLFGKWAYGFWQCKNRYSSQENIAISTSLWTTLCRIGSGGRQRASSNSTTNILRLRR
jgi:alpha-D-xyloside xylohydrolase